MDEEERALQACERAVIICTSADRLGDVATGAWYGPRPPPPSPPPPAAAARPPTRSVGGCSSRCSARARPR